MHTCPLASVCRLIPFPDECKKAGKILASFVDPRQAFGPDKVIPPSILQDAKVARDPIVACRPLLRLANIPSSLLGPSNPDGYQGRLSRLSTDGIWPCSCSACRW